MNYWLLLLPLFAAVIGWTIHAVVINLFLSRILPKRKKAIASILGKAAASEFAQFTSLKEKINDPSNFEKLRPVIENHVDHFLNERLKQEMPMISMFIGNKTTDKLKEIFLKELEVLFPEVIDQFAIQLQSGMDIEKSVISRIENINDYRAEQLIKDKLSAELKYVRILGAVTGFIIGLLQVLIAALTGLM